MNATERTEELLRSSEDELYLALGRQLYGTPAFPPQSSHLRQMAKQWLAANHEALRQAVCGSKRCKDLAAQDLKTHEQVVLATAIADLISHVTLGVAPVTVAVLLVRQGVHHLCKETWGCGSSTF